MQGDTCRAGLQALPIDRRVSIIITDTVGRSTAFVDSSWNFPWNIYKICTRERDLFKFVQGPDSQGHLWICTSNHADHSWQIYETATTFSQELSANALKWCTNVSCCNQLSCAVYSVGNIGLATAVTFGLWCCTNATCSLGHKSYYVPCSLFHISTEISVHFRTKQTNYMAFFSLHFSLFLSLDENKNEFTPWCNHEANMKEMYSIYTCTTCALSLLHVCLMYAWRLLQVCFIV